MKDLIMLYEEVKALIEKRLAEFRALWHNASQKELFKELAFCLLTPQSKAKVCWSAIEKLWNSDLLFKGDEEEIRKILIGIRFKNNKSRYIIEARNTLSRNGELIIREIIKQYQDIFKLRDWLVKSIKGMGYKEASHFLRNVGFGKDIAILDRHVLKNLKFYGVIQDIPTSLSRKEYIEIEKRMREFSKQIKIPMEHLDFVFWFKETREVFK